MATTNATIYDQPTTFREDEMGANTDFTEACAKVSEGWDFDDLLDASAKPDKAVWDAEYSAMIKGIVQTAWAKVAVANTTEGSALPGYQREFGRKVQQVLEWLVSLIETADCPESWYALYEDPEMRQSAWAEYLSKCAECARMALVA